MMTYSWPGNVRELQSVMHRAAAMAESDELDGSDLELPDDEPSDLASTFVPETIVTDKGGFHAMKVKTIDEFERMYLRQILTEHQGNVSKAARAAKKERRAFQRLLHKHGLNRHLFSAA